MHTTVYPAQKRATNTACWLPLLFVLSAILISAALLLDDYGASTDEKFEMDLLTWNSALVRNGTPIPTNGRFYGIVSAAAGEAIYQVLKRVFGWPSDNWMVEFRYRIRAKHLVAFGFALVAYTCVSVFAAMIVGWSKAWIAPALLLLFPRFFGHSFFNPKDIPFAAMFTLANLALATNATRMLRSDQHPLRNQYIYGIVCGVLVGIATGVRIGAVVLLALAPVAHMVLHFTRRKPLALLLQCIPAYGVMYVAWFATTVVEHPASWANPFFWVWSTLRYMSSHPFSGTVLFEGVQWSASNLPWYYLPKMILISTPEWMMALFLVGLCLAVRKWRTMSGAAQAALLFVLLQFFFIPTYAIISNASMYDGIRHFLFVLPAAAVVACAAIVWVYQSLQKRATKLAFIFALALGAALVVYEMKALHPYQYCYFNRTFGGLKAAEGMYETDYWALSMREGAEWINANAPEGSVVISSRESFAVWTVAKPGIDVISFDRYLKENPPRPFFYIAKPRWNFQQRFPDCPVVFKVKRQEATLTIVKRCDGRSAAQTRVHARN